MLCCIRNDPADSEKKHKLWRGFKKAKGCATPKNSPQETAASLLTEQFINQLMVLMQFLQLEESECFAGFDNICKYVLILFLQIYHKKEYLEKQDR